MSDVVIPCHIPRRASFLAALIIVMHAGSANAQKTDLKPDAAAVKLDSVTSVYGDWTARCKRDLAGVMACEAAQYVLIPKQRQAAAQIILRKAGSDWSMSIEVAPNIALPANMSVELGPGGSAIEMRWTQCMATACIARTELSSAVLDPWARAAAAGRFSFRDASGQDIMFPISPHGLSAALQSFPQP